MPKGIRNTISVSTLQWFTDNYISYEVALLNKLIGAMEHAKCIKKDVQETLIKKWFLSEYKHCKESGNHEYHRLTGNTLFKEVK